MNALRDDVAAFKNLHLLTSIILIVPIALAYGSSPNVMLLKLFSISVETVNLSNIFRATMGLYLGFAGCWIVGIVKPAYWTTATLTNIVFMGGLAFGRLLSLILDGLPSYYFLVGLLLEVIFAIWGVINLRKYTKNIGN